VLVAIETRKGVLTEALNLVPVASVDPAPAVSRDSDRAEVPVSAPAAVEAWGPVVAQVSMAAAGDADLGAAPDSVADLDLAPAECRM
jgi:hypothetical protein